MSWLAVARKDFRDAIRSSMFLAIATLFLVVSLGLAIAYTQLDIFSGGNPQAEGIITLLVSAVSFFLPLVALVVCYRSIAGERSTGSIKILLSLPHTRLDVLAGKLVGRTGVLAAPVAVALVAGTLLGAVLIGDIAPVTTLMFALASLLFATAYISIYLGISALVSTTTRAAALGLTYFVVVELLWDAVPFTIVFVLNGFSIPQQFPDWVYLVNQVAPSTAYSTSLYALIPEFAQAVGPSSSVQFDAVYATPWVGVVSLLLWIGLPFALGYARFERVDL